MKTRILLSLATASVVSAASIVDFNFDNTLANAGTYGGTGSFVTLTNNTSNLVPAYSANAGGVSGLAGDYAMDNTSASGMGGVGGATQLSFTPTAQTFTALTVSGWFKTDVANQFNGRILSTNDGSNIGFQLVFLDASLNGGNNALRFQVNNNGADTGTGTADSSASASLNSNNSWVFFSVVYAGLNDVRFYTGNTTTQATLLNTITNFAPTSIGTRANEVLNIGNASGLSSATQRAWDGLLDNIRIDDTALTLAQIQSIQAAAIPEPGTLALVGIALGSLVLFRRRR